MNEAASLNEAFCGSDIAQDKLYRYLRVDCIFCL